MTKKLVARLAAAVFVLALAFIPSAYFSGAFAARAESVNQTASQAEESIQERIVRFTDSDYLDGDPNTDIREFADNYKKDKYSPKGEPPVYQAYHVTEIIGKVVPIELLFTEGVRAYMGMEYAFITYADLGKSDDMFAELLLIDFEIDFEKTDSGLEINNQPIYRMEVLLGTVFEIREEFGKYELYRPRTVLPVDIFLKNVFIAATMENENEYNAYDAGYDHQEDGGDIIMNVAVDYRATEYKDGDADASDLIKWAVDKIITKSLDAVGDLGIPAVSPAANIVGKAWYYAKKTSDFISKADNLLEESEQKEVIIESGTVFCKSNLSKDKHAKLSLPYPREVYVSQKQMDDVAVALFKPDRTSNDDNGFIQMKLVTSGDSSSRFNFVVGFEAVFKNLGNNPIIVKEDGSYGIDTGEKTEAATFIHTVQYKEFVGADHIRDVSGYENSYTKYDSRDPAYILDKDGYAIYKFTPKFRDEYAFGKYTFRNIERVEHSPTTYIYLLKPTHNGVAIDLDELVNMTNEEILKSDYLLAYNGTDFDFRNKLEYDFVDRGSVSENTYYVLYKYVGEYDKSCSFYARSEFTPETLAVDKTVSAVVKGKRHYSFYPEQNDNYVFTADGLSDGYIEVYDSHNELIVSAPKESHVLLKGGEKYIVRIDSRGGDGSARVTARVGNEIALSNFVYAASFDLCIRQTQYFKIMPQNLTGTYKLNCEYLSGMRVYWYNSYLEPIERDRATAYLNAGGTYYIALENITAKSFVGEFTVAYDASAIAFESRVEALPDGYDYKLCFVTEESLPDGIDSTFTLAANYDIVCKNVRYSGHRFTYDITRLNYMGADKYSFSGYICVNGDENIYIKPIVMDFNKTVYKSNKDVTLSSPYEKFTFEGSATGDVKVSVSSAVKVLTLQSVEKYAVSGIRFEIAQSVEPLFVYLKDCDFTAPLSSSLITSRRDIVLLCLGKSRLTGGRGEDDGDYLSKNGCSAFDMPRNTLVINSFQGVRGTDELTLKGGDGGYFSDNKVYKVTSKAGNGGIAVQALNVVIRNNKLTISGGRGGNGGRGKDGAAGANSTGLQSNGVGARGGDGEDGSPASGGGDGGYAFCVYGEYIAVYATDLTAYGGQGGYGGRGGDGGAGGNGAKGKDGGAFGGQCGGGSGGNGGRGGRGGDGGCGMYALNESAWNKIKRFSAVDHSAMLKKAYSAGKGGAGGTGGKGGIGGAGGKNTWGVKAPNGANGIDGADGNVGINP